MEESNTNDASLHPEPEAPPLTPYEVFIGMCIWWRLCRDWKLFGVIGPILDSLNTSLDATTDEVKQKRLQYMVQFCTPADPADPADPAAMLEPWLRHDDNMLNIVTAELRGEGKARWNTELLEQPHNNDLAVVIIAWASLLEHEYWPPEPAYLALFTKSSCCELIAELIALHIDPDLLSIMVAGVKQFVDTGDMASLLVEKELPSAFGCATPQHDAKKTQLLYSLTGLLINALSDEVGEDGEVIKKRTPHDEETLRLLLKQVLTWTYPDEKAKLVAMQVKTWLLKTNESAAAEQDSPVLCAPEATEESEDDEAAPHSEAGQNPFEAMGSWMCDEDGETQFDENETQLASGTPTEQLTQVGKDTGTASATSSQRTETEEAQYAASDGCDDPPSVVPKRSRSSSFYESDTPEEGNDGGAAVLLPGTAQKSGRADMSHRSC